jgi:hypothetical protein
VTHRIGESSEKVWEFSKGNLGNLKKILNMPIFPLRFTIDLPHQRKQVVTQRGKGIPHQYAHKATPTSQTRRLIIWLKISLESGLFPCTSTRVVSPNLELSSHSPNADLQISSLFQKLIPVMRMKRVFLG